MDREGRKCILYRVSINKEWPPIGGTVRRLRFARDHLSNPKSYLYAYLAGECARFDPSGARERESWGNRTKYGSV